VTVRCVLGVDGGASKTHTLVIEESGRVLGLGQAGGSNHQVHGLDPAVREIAVATRSAISEAGLTPEAIGVGCCCLAGADLPEDHALLQRAMEGLNFAQKVIVKNDTMAALRAGLTRAWGVVVVCGTGFNAAGRSPAGEEIILPGLGAMSGDWGGGGDLSREMIRLVMRAWDGRGKPTLLTKLVLDALQTPSIEVLLSRLYHREIEQHRILDLVPLLFEAAEAEDEVAEGLIERMGTEVGVTALALIRRLNLATEDVEIVLAGGTYKGEGSLLIDTIRRVVHEEAPRAKIVRPRYESVIGAALLALDSLGVPLTEARRKLLESTLPGGLIAAEVFGYGRRSCKART
jgi:N-acetylglucosamine kinase-like BadF-type ATPase